MLECYLGMLVYPRRCGCVPKGEASLIQGKAVFLQGGFWVLQGDGWVLFV